MDYNSFELENCKKKCPKQRESRPKGLEVQFSPNLFSRNFLEPEPEPELELNFAFGPEGSGSN